MSVRTFLAEPWSAVAEESRVAAGVWVVAFVAVVDAVEAIVDFTVQRTDDSARALRFATGETAVEGSLTLVSFALASALTLLVFWAVYVGSTHLLARLIGGATDASVRVTAGYVGWTFFPLAVGSLLESAGVLALSPTPPPTPADNPEAIYAVSQMPLIRLVHAVQVVLLCWAAVLVVHAVADAHDLTRRQAAIASAVPLLVTAVGVASLVVNPEPIVID